MLSKPIADEFKMPVPRFIKTYPGGPYRFIDREYLIITYESDPTILKSILPPELELIEPIVKFEFIRMPDSSGFGDYTESGQVIPVRYHGEEGIFTVSMYLDSEAPIACGREIWGFPKKLAKPKLFVESDTLVGLLDYGSIRIAIATMGYKHHEMDPELVLDTMKQPTFLLKNIPDVNGNPAICQLTRTYLSDVIIKGAWSGPAGLELHAHALATVAALPVLRVISAVHCVTDLTLPYGEVVENYLVENKK
jgi:acetoacetate decarboxylase